MTSKLPQFEEVLPGTNHIYQSYIDGVWVKGSGDKIDNILNPANNQVLARVHTAAEKDADHAVKAAKRAFYQDGWKDVYARDRASLLLKVARKLEERKEEFAKLETLNNGKIYEDALGDIEDSINQFEFYAGLATKPKGQTYDVPDDIQSMVVREPVGVVALIVPWNFPLVMATQKMAAALAAGCTVTIKPDSKTPLTLIRLFEILDDINFPKGVVNLVLGSGSVVGETFITHPEVDKISFTGSTNIGKHIMKNAADSLTKVGLELGGKSPNMVFSDADFDTAVDYALLAIFAGTGQVCSAGSRLILDNEIYDDFVKALKEKASKIIVGPGYDDEVEMGPMISEGQMKSVLDYINIGQDEGATLLCGGYQLSDGVHSEGNYIAPTIFTDTTPDMRIVQEEIFGPVLVIQRFDTEAEAIELANHTRYGLAASVFTNDGAKAQRVIRQVRAGITWINTFHPTFNEAPWSGYKESGIGGDLGTYGFEEYLYKKQINIALDVKPSGAYHF